MSNIKEGLEYFSIFLFSFGVMMVITSKYQALGVCFITLAWLAGFVTLRIWNQEDNKNMKTRGLK